MEGEYAVVETGGGAAPWMLLLLVAFLAATLLDRMRAGEIEGRQRRARWFGLLALSLVGVAGVALAWGSPLSEVRRWREAAVWWAPSLIVLWLGAWSARAGATGAMTRLAAAQAVPAILLQLAPPLGWRVGGALLAGLARLGVPPLHPLHTAAAETLSLGTLLVLLVVSLVLGAPPALASVVAVGGNPPWIAVLLALATGAIGVAALRDFSMARRLAVWGSTQASLAVLAIWIAAGDPPVVAVEGLQHAAACAAYLSLAAVGFGGVEHWLRTDDLRAFGGLHREARWRSLTLLAIALSAPVFSGGAADTLVRLGLGATTPWFARLAVVAALVGWLGVNLSLALAAYRVARGQRPSPGEAVGELRLPEAAALIALLLFTLWVFTSDAFGHTPTAWSALAGAS